MRRKQLHVCLFIMLTCCGICPQFALAQNIFSGEPVQITGSMNGYITTSATNSVYRRITTTTGNPTDGRGQWVKTYNAQPSGGDFVNVNMAGGGGNGFLFISGPPTNRFQNKWVFTNVAQGRVDSINVAGAYNTGNDMGLNMSVAGRYTFVFNDCGYTNVNARYYVGYTTNNPVGLTSISNNIQSNNSITVNISTTAAPSAGERIFVRYTLGNNFASTGSSFIVEATATNSPTNTSWQATIPTQPSGTTIRYYVFSSTLALTTLNQLSETDRSLCALQVNDNTGNNYSVSLAPKFNITFSVNLANNCAVFDSVTVAGNQTILTNWNNGLKLNRVGTTQVYNLVVAIDSGTALQYKFRTHRNGQPSWEGTFATTSGNREITITKDTVPATPCFGGTGACAIWPAPSTVTFVVDLTGQTIDPLGRVYVIGNFASPTWIDGAVRMTPIVGAPNHYQAVVNNVCPGFFEYKFVNGDSALIANQETFPNPALRGCTSSNGIGGFNRTYTRINTTPVLLGAVFNTCNTAVPVGFLNVSAHAVKEGAIIKWSTAYEKNNKGFYIEKSNDGEQFEAIVFINGVGNSATVKSYEYIDKQVYGTTYYRIKQIDFDGTTSFSSVVTLAKNSLKEIELFPMPFEDKIQVKLSNPVNGELNWSISNTSGVIITSGIVQANNQEFVINDNSLNKLANGVYILTIKNGQTISTYKLIK